MERGGGVRLCVREISCSTYFASFLYLFLILFGHSGWLLLALLNCPLWTHCGFCITLGCFFPLLNVFTTYLLFPSSSVSSYLLHLLLFLLIPIELALSSSFFGSGCVIF